MQTGLPALSEQDRFDEAGYLRLYPEIRQAIAAGAFASAWQHFDRHGRTEGRRPDDLDPGYYCGTYRQVEEAHGRLSATGCAVHYAAIGRARGYLPNRSAPRAAPAEGLWTDAADAPARIDTLEADGRITDRQAAMLRRWRQDGYLLLDRPASRDRWEPAALDLERLFGGALPELPVHCPALAPAPSPWSAEIAPNPADALDVHHLSAPVRALILGDPLAEFLKLLFEERALLAATRGFLRPPIVPPRRASARFGCSIPGRFIATWLALEDALDLTVWPNSHRLPRLTVAGQPSLPDAERFGLAAGAIEACEAAFQASLATSGLPPRPLRIGRGECVLLHPDLAHATHSVPPLATARGIAAELCPASLMPAYAEHHPVSLHSHGADRFTSRHCDAIGPLW